MVNKYSVSKDTKLSDHFKVSEFACKDGSDEVLVDDLLVSLLELLRTQVKKPIKVVSGYRTEAYNTKCGGAKSSYHMKGQAADIAVDGVNTTVLGMLATEIGFSGVGVYDSWVHCDTRDIPYKFISTGGKTYGI